MRSGGVKGWLRRALCALAVVSGIVVSAWHGPEIRAEDPAPEVRALWVLRTSLATPRSVSALVRTAREHGFNTLLVQVRGRGDAYFISRLEPRPAELAGQADTFDPLADTIAEAHQAGLRVHAWISLNLVSSAVELPASREHLIYRHPEWLMVPREIAQEAARLDATSPAYVGKLARWTRGQSETVEGLYASPVIPEAAAHAVAVVADVARRYPVDGIHLDYARYPNEQFDYSRFAIAEFRAQIRPRLVPAVRTEVDARETVDLFAYPDRFPEAWKTFRRDRMSALMMRLRTAVRTARPGALVTVAAAPDARDAFDHRLQDWRTWLENGSIDAVCPMAYTPEAGRFAEQIAAVRDIAGGHAVWAGIGSYRLTPAQTIEDIQAARRLGTGGFILFSYDSLSSPKQAWPDYFALVSRAAFGAPRGADSGSR